MKRLYWKIYIYWLALRWVNKLNLGDEVVHNGKIYRLTQGVMKPLWNLSGESGRLERVHETEFQKRKTIANYWGSYRSGINFYMNSWYMIWVNEGIKPWMRGCNIWKR